MGKRKDMKTIQLEEFMHSDHAVFGHLVIARQSSSEIKEASMFVEKPSPESRKLEKAKSDNAMLLRRQTYQRSGSLRSVLRKQRNGTANGFKRDGKYEAGGKGKEMFVRHWRSAEFPTTTEKRNMTGDYLDHKPKSALLTSANGQSSFRCSPSRSFVTASDSNEVLPDGVRDLELSNRKSPLFLGSSSVSCESSIEEETEDDRSITGGNLKPRNERKTIGGICLSYWTNFCWTFM
jgi:hypothetical protein